MKKQLTFGVALVAIATGVILGTVYASSHYLAQADHQPQAVSCRQTGANHKVTITNDKLSATHVQAALCDTLTIINQDDTTRNMAFGQHTHHQPYDGITEKLLTKGQSLTVTLDQAGTYTFHDHYHDEVAGEFTVR